jgi:hypothetical protein
MMIARGWLARITAEHDACTFPTPYSQRQNGMHHVNERPEKANFRCAPSRAGGLFVAKKTPVGALRESAGIPNGITYSINLTSTKMLTFREA